MNRPAKACFPSHVSRWLIRLVLPVIAFPCSLAGQTIDSPSEFLDLLGFDKARRQAIREFHGPIEKNQQLVSLIQQWGRLSRQNQLAWSETEVDWDQVGANPQPHIDRLLPVRGQLHRVKRIELDPEIATRFDLPCLFECELTLEDRPGTTGKLWLRQLPKPLQPEPSAKPPERTLDEPVATIGLMIDCRDGSPRWIANQLQWYPQPDSPLIPTPDWAWLAKWGMDISGLTAVHDRKPLTADDRDPFYQMLSVMGRVPATALREAAQQSGAMELLQNPDQHRGRIYSVTGTARRIVRIEVDDPYIRQQMGVTHYFELELFDARARVRVPAQGDSKERAFNSYPIVCCVRSLPAGVQTGDLVREHMTVTGVFLKLWAYRSPFMESATAGRTDGKRPLQVSPLLIGAQPRRVVVKTSSHWQTRSVVGLVLAILGAACSLLAVWLASADNRRSHDSMLSRHSKANPDELLKPWDESQ